MSYTIKQRPDAYSLTSTIKDYIIESTQEIEVQMKLGNRIIIIEDYTPDINNLIYILDIGKLIDYYLEGDIEVNSDVITQDKIVTELNVLIDEVVVDRITVLKCKSYTEIEAKSFHTGEIYLNALFQKKITTVKAKEYISMYVPDTGSTLKVCVTTLQGDTYIDSDYKIVPIAINQHFVSVDISFERIAALFPTVSADTIIAYRISMNDQIQIYAVDRTAYQQQLHFIYANSFGVPDTIITRGQVLLKGLPTYEMSTIRGTHVKFDMSRDDTFDVSSGKIFSSNDYFRFKEMIDSGDVRLLWQGKYRKIVIIEEGSNVNQNISYLQPISFTFKFAESKMNSFISGESFKQWILRNGKWDDEGVWLDTGHWIDDPIN